MFPTAFFFSLAAIAAEFNFCHARRECLINYAYFPFSNFLSRLIQVALCVQRALTHSLTHTPTGIEEDKNYTGPNFIANRLGVSKIAIDCLRQSSLLILFYLWRTLVFFGVLQVWGGGKIG